MLASAAVRRSHRLGRNVLRFKSSHVKGASSAGIGPIGEDGRHEIWREGIYDHDNEPK